MQKNKNLFRNLICALFCAFPLIEIYRVFFGDTVSVFGIAVEELVPILWAWSLFIAGIVYAISEKKVKLVWAIGIYCFVFIVFLILHGMNVLKFNTGVFPTATPDFIVECYYLIRVYASPIALAFAVFSFGLPEEKISKTARIVVLEISALIVITNIFKISFVSYSDELRRISGNIFSWFSLPDNTDFALYTSKGLFGSANAIGALLFAVSPIVFRDAFKHRDAVSVITAILTGLGAIMLGTKVACFGTLLSMGAVFVLFLIFTVIKKDYKKLKFSSVFFILFAVSYIVLMLISPGYKMQKGIYIEKETGSRDTDITEINSIISNSENQKHIWTEEEKVALEKYMEENHYYHYVNEWFLEIYPVRQDMDFWTEIVTRDNSLNQSNRRFKTDITRRISERNENRQDKLFGIGYTSNVPYTEKDYVYQYFIYGISGLIVLILPFILSFAVNLGKCIKMIFKKKEFFEISVFAVSLGAYLFAAFFAGHVFDILINMYFAAFFSVLPFAVVKKDGE